jgi:hypothetical protein
MGLGEASPVRPFQRDDARRGWGHQRAHVRMPERGHQVRLTVDRNIRAAHLSPPGRTFKILICS